MSTYAEQKKTKPVIEDMIPKFLSGEKKRLALDFVDYLRAQKMQPTWASDNSWKCSSKSKGVCYVRLREGYLSVSPYVEYTSEFETYVKAENLQDIIWSNLAFCRRCHVATCAPRLNENEDTFNGVTKTFMGREFANICIGGGGAHFHDPDEADIDCIKKLIDFRRQAIAGNTVSTVKYVGMKRRISKTEVIELSEDIKVVGLSLEKAGWAKRGDKVGDLWGLYSDEHRIQTNAKMPITNYGFWFEKPDGYDYIVGCEVVAFSDTGDEQIACTIPAGRYIKDTFNAYDFSDLVSYALGNRDVKKWAAENGLQIKRMPPFPVTGIEVYPVQEMVAPTGEAISENFKQSDRLTAKFPCMYTLTPVE